MDKLRRAELLTLEAYHAQRPAFRTRVMAHKAARQVRLGPHVTLYFEDRLTMLYQVQEMLRVERIFEADAIEQELDAYNPLVPDGDNWKATLMIEYTDVAERKTALASLSGVEHRVWTRVAQYAPVWAIADEDMERSREAKTSAVHFLRFQLDGAMVAAARAGAAIAFGVDHEACREWLDPVPETIRSSLAADLDGTPDKS